MNTSSRRALLLASLALACTPVDDPPQGPGASTDDDGTGEDSTGAPDPSCPAPTQGPTMVTDITAASTWSAAGSPYVIDHGISIRAALTLEPCTEIRIGGGVTVQVRDDGSIEGLGTAEQPITIGALDPEQPWASLAIVHGNAITLRHATVADGGDPGALAPGDAAMIDAQALDAVSDETLRFDHVTVRGSASQGIRLRDGARFSADSTSLVVTEGASVPVNLWANGLSSLPDGDYGGNADDRIVVVGTGGGEIDQDVTVHDRGVPYLIDSVAGGTQLRVTGGVLTLEPGVELQFGSGGALHVDYGSYPGLARAALVAVGNDDDPVVFTSAAAQPAAGDWYGVYFWNQPDPRDVIDHARVEFAGGSSQIGSGACTTDGIGVHDAAIRFLGTGGQISPDGPDGQIVTHTTIDSSAGSGIDRGWFGAPIDYVPSNSFVDVAQCLQSYPHPESPQACPEPAPCPQ